MTSDVQRQIRDRIDEFLHELDALVRQAAVASVSLALGDGAPPLRRARTLGRVAAVRARGRRKGDKRDPKELEQLAARLLTHISKNAGQRIEQIAKVMGATTKQLALPAKKLIADRKIRTTGNRRATKYFMR